MICGLFSSFDPTILTSSYKSKWIFLSTILLFPMQINPLFGLSYYLYKLFMFMSSLLKSSFLKYKNPLLLMSSLFFFIFSMNLMGLVPYTFSMTSHLSVNLSLSLALWMSAMILSVLFSLKKLVAHLVPMGSPLPLWPLLVMVESVSVIIRPWTLSIRLMANVMAGHLIMSLIGMGFSKIFFLFVPSILLMSGFIFFEVCVSLIQSYVFTSLLVLYWSD